MYKSTIVILSLPTFHILSSQPDVDHYYYYTWASCQVAGFTSQFHILTIYQLTGYTRECYGGFALHQHMKTVSRHEGYEVRCNNCGQSQHSMSKFEQHSHEKH